MTDTALHPPVPQPGPTAPAPAGPPTPSRPHYRVGLIAAALLLIVSTLVAYAPAIRGGFIWDDDDYVENNWVLRSTDGLKAIWTDPRSIPQWYPAVHTMFWAEYQFWGLNPAGYKVVNVLLHCGSAILLWVLLRKLKVPGAWLAATVFALHPVHVESVAWITERKNTLSGFFYLASMLVYLWAIGLVTRPSFALRQPPERWPRERVNWTLYAIAFGLFVLALLSKTITCSLPAAVLLVLYWKRGRFTARDVAHLLPFFLAGAALAYVTAHIEATHVGATGPEFDLSVAQRVLIAGRALWFYAWKLLAPFHLSFIYPRWTVDPRDWTQWLYPLGFLGTLAVLYVYRNTLTRGPLVAFLFFAGTLVPALGFVNVYPMRYSFVADHFQYLASIGLIALMVGATEAMSRALDHVNELSPTGKWVKHALATDLPFILPLAVLTFWQAQTYHDRFTLWSATVERNPSSWMPHVQLGHAYVTIKQDGDKALAEYRKALELAPNVPEPHYNVGYRLAVAGQYEQALQQYREALRLDPSFALAYYAAGNAYRELGDAPAAADHYRKALALNPRMAPAHLNLGFLYEQQGRLPEAEAEYRAALGIEPEYAQARQNLASVLFRQGNHAGAAHILRGGAP